MPYLIILAAIFGIISSMNKKKKKQEQDAARKQAAQAQAGQAAQTEQQQIEQLRARQQAQRAAAQAKQPVIPSTFTPEEWEAYMNARLDKAAPAPEPVKEAAAQPIPAPEVIKQPVFAQSLDAHEAEGETHAEHAAHNERVQARERAERQRFESLRDRRFASRQRMRDAIVMSEILGKPVSLKKRQATN